MVWAFVDERFTGTRTGVGVKGRPEHRFQDGREAGDQILSGVPEKVFGEGEVVGDKGLLEGGGEEGPDEPEGGEVFVAEGDDGCGGTWLSCANWEHKGCLVAGGAGLVIVLVIVILGSSVLLGSSDLLLAGDFFVGFHLLLLGSHRETRDQMPIAIEKRLDDSHVAGLEAILQGDKLAGAEIPMDQREIKRAAEFLAGG